MVGSKSTSQRKTYPDRMSALTKQFSWVILRSIFVCQFTPTTMSSWAMRVWVYGLPSLMRSRSTRFRHTASCACS